TSTIRLQLPPPDGRVILEIVSVANLSAVSVNEVPCGWVCTAPYRLDITVAVNAGTSASDIKVTNTWANRLIGDRKEVGGGDRVTWTTAPYRLSGTLQPAGLLGPVYIRTEQNEKTSEK